jgi:TRAP-type mannitol/chloroaromatic compound transport system substrate-binding protein
VNLRAWRRLPEEYRAMFSTACAEANLEMLSRYEALNAAALVRLRQGGTQLQFYGDAILGAAREASFQLLADSAARDGGFRALFEQWRSFRRELTAWNGVNEFPLARFSYADPEAGA